MVDFDSFAAETEKREGIEFRICEIGFVHLHS